MSDSRPPPRHRPLSGTLPSLGRVVASTWLMQCVWTWETIHQAGILPKPRQTKPAKSCDVSSAQATGAVTSSKRSASDKSQAPTLSRPTLKGVTAEWLKQFANGCEKLLGDSWPTVSTRDICNKVVMPATAGANAKADVSCYLDLAPAQGNSSTPSMPAYVEATANVYVSHAWDNRFSDLVAALEKFSSSQTDSENAVVFWIDIFSLNQHKPAGLQAAEWPGQVLRPMMQDIGHVVSLLSPWDKPALLQRTWCMWELSCAVASPATKLSMVMTATDEQHLHTAITTSPEAVRKKVLAVDIERSKTTDPADLARLKADLRHQIPGGVAGANAAVFKWMLEWYRQHVRQVVADLQKSTPSSSEPPSCPYDDLPVKCARILLSVDLSDEAAALCEGEVKARRRKGGQGTSGSSEDLLRLAATVSQMAMAHYLKHDFAAALPYYEELHDIYRQVYGNVHPACAEAAGNVGLCHFYLGQAEGALTNLELAANVSASTLGPDDPTTAGWLYQFGLAHLELRVDPQISLGALRDALRIRRKEQPPNLIALAKVHLHLGDAHRRVGSFGEAVKHHKKALKEAMSAYGESHTEMTMYYEAMSIDHRQLGQFDVALKFANKVLEIRLADAGGTESTTVALSYNNIGNIHASQDDNEKALDFFNKSLAIRLKLLGTNHPDTAMSYANIGACQQRLRKTQQARKSLLKALELYNKIGMPVTPEVGMVYLSLSQNYRDTDQFAEAAMHAHRALQVTEVANGPRHPMVGNAYMAIARSLLDLDQTEGSTAAAEAAAEVYAACYGPDHPQTQEARVFSLIYGRLRQHLGK